MFKKYFYLLSLLSFLLVFGACKKEYDAIQTVDDAVINAYVSKNPGFINDNGATAYYYKINDLGTGAAVANTDSVFYGYSFKSLDGATTYNKTIEYLPSGNYLGYTDNFSIGGKTYKFVPFREVLARLHRGGSATLILPSRFAFGKNGLAAYGIAGNENLLVDISVRPESKRHELDEALITKFIAANNLTLTKDPSRARYNVITPGTGTEVIGDYSTVVANYTVRYLDGTVIPQPSGQITSRLDQLYKGWRLILPNKVKAGGKLRLVIPSDLAGGGEPLDFDIEIVSVTN